MFPQMVTALVMMVISSALQAIGRQQPEQPKAPEPGKLDIPTAEEGGAVPVIFGTVMIKKSNVIWYGDPNTTPIKQGSGSAGKKG